MRILVRTSRLASWARRFGSFALPLAVIPVFLHRRQMLDSETFLLIEVMALAFAALGLLAGLAAFVRLWFTGDKGWGRAVVGVILGFICLSPLVFAGAQATQYPMAAIASTDFNARVTFVRAPARPPIDSAMRDEILNTFPNLITRRYLLTANQMFQIVDKNIAARGWETIKRQPPELETTQAQINAVQMTLLGWQDEIVIAIDGQANGVNVAVHSASIAHVSNDLGRNGRRIEKFLLDLDDSVAEALRNPALLDGPPIPASR